MLPLLRLKSQGSEDSKKSSVTPIRLSDTNTSVSSNGLKWFYAVGLLLAFLVYGTLDINIKTSSVVSRGPTIILEVNLRKPKTLDVLLDEYNYSDGEIDEESIVDDPLTDLILDGDEDDIDHYDIHHEEVEEIGRQDDEEDELKALSDTFTTKTRTSSKSKTKETDEEAEQEEEEDWSGLTDFEIKQRQVQDVIDNYKGPIRVALYVGAGTTTNARNNIPYVLSRCSNNKIIVSKIKDGSLSEVGRLKHDVIFIPGGSAGRIYAEMATESKKNNKLGPQTKIRKFLERGGGYIGVCAGAYLAAGGKSGRSPLKISLFKTESGMLGDGYISGTQLDETVIKTKYLKERISSTLDDNLLANSQLFYANGPIFKNGTYPNPEFPQLSSPQVILRIKQNAYVRTLVGNKNGKSTHRRHQGLPVIVMNKFGRGNVVLSTGHPETDVHSVTYNTWKAAKEPSRCDSQEAQLLLSMVYLASGRSINSIEV